MSEEARGPSDPGLPTKSDATTDLGLTLPIFVAYHLGVVFLPIRNAADPVTSELKDLAKHSLPMYGAITLGLGAAFVIVLWSLGQKRALDPGRFAWIAIEGTLYAIVMRFAGSYAVGSLRLGGAGGEGVFTSVVMALGAGFYEEIVFRAGIFGIGALVLKGVFGKGLTGTLARIGWALCAAAMFAGWHYIGALGDPWDPKSFVFRAVCGLVLTTIFALRGFAPAVWTHVIYDVWVMIFG